MNFHELNKTGRKVFDWLRKAMSHHVIADYSKVKSTGWYMDATDGLRWHVVNLERVYGYDDDGRYGLGGDLPHVFRIAGFRDGGVVIGNTDERIGYRILRNAFPGLLRGSKRMSFSVDASHLRDAVSKLNDTVNILLQIDEDGNVCNPFFIGGKIDDVDVFAVLSTVPGTSVWYPLPMREENE